MSALPHRHHGGDRLDRAVHGLPAYSKYVMIQKRCAGAPKVNHPPDQDVNTRAPTTIGAPVHSRNSQIQDALSDPRIGGRHGRRPTSAPYTPNGDRPGNRQSSTPIPQAAGGAV